MKEKFQQVNILRHGEDLKLDAILPMGEKEGFFFVRPHESEKHRGPLQVKAVTLELMDGSTMRVQVKDKQHYTPGSLEWSLAWVLKGLVDSKSDLIRIAAYSKIWKQYITYKNLAGAFNQNLEINSAIGLSVRKVGELCRDVLKQPVGRENVGWVVYLDEGSLYLMADEFGLTNLPDESE